MVTTLLSVDLELERELLLVSTLETGATGLGTDWMLPPLTVVQSLHSPTEEELKELELSWEVEVEENCPLTLLPVRVPLVSTVTAGPWDTVPVKLVTNGDLPCAVTAEDEDELRAA